MRNDEINRRITEVFSGKTSRESAYAINIPAERMRINFMGEKPAKIHSQLTRRLSSNDRRVNRVSNAERISRETNTA
jgi:hypothetical protein